MEGFFHSLFSEKIHMEKKFKWVKKINAKMQTELHSGTSLKKYPTFLRQMPVAPDEGGQNREELVFSR